MPRRTLDASLSRPFGIAELRQVRLLRQSLLDRRPAHRGVFQETRRIGGECIAVFLAAEQIKPLVCDGPKARAAGIGHPSPQIDRIIAAELGPVDLRVGDKGGAVALIAEAPDGARFAGLEIGQPRAGWDSVK